MLHRECRWGFDNKDALEQALSNLIIIILIEVPDLIMLVLPPVETGLKRVRMSNAHAVDF